METEAGVEIDLDLVKRRSLVGVFSLVSRSFLVQMVAFVSTLLLTIFLEPETFGVFFLVSALINFFAYFSDVGLAAALIQRQEKLTLSDLRTTFFIQQCLVVVLLLVIVGLSGPVSRWYGLEASGLFLFYALTISFFLSSLKTIPSVILERSLKFDLLVIPQILETFVFNLLAVFLAWQGWGLRSFAWAVLARGVVGLIAMYWLSPWRIGFAFSLKSLRELLRFGVPYQANTIIAVLKDDLMMVILGKVVGTTGLGYLGWAKKWAELPLRFFMDNVNKVAFPAFSRVQQDKAVLRRGVEKSIFFLSFLTFPLLVGFSVLASDLVNLLPRYLKWQPAIIALYLYCFNSGWALVSTTMTNLLNAIGKIKITFRLMVMWLVLSWLLMPIAGLRYGYNGVAWAVGLIALSSVAAIWAARREVCFALFGPLVKPLMAAVLMGVVVFFLRPSWGSLGLSVVGRVFAGFISYLLFSYLLLGREKVSEIAGVLHGLKKSG